MALEQTFEQRQRTFKKALSEADKETFRPFVGKSINLNANDIQEENPAVVPENTGDTTSTDRILDLTASTADLQEELDRQFEEKEVRRGEVETELEAERKKQKTLREKATDFIRTRPSREDELKGELTRLGVEDDIQQVRSLITEVGSLRIQLNKIDEAKALAIEGLAGQGRGIPLSIIRGQQAKTERQYNIRRAAVAAELGAKAATAEALRGNAEFAAKLAQDTVDAIVFDYQQKVNDYEDLFEYNQDIIDGLTTEQKGILEQQRDDAKDELERRREESTIVSGMMIDNPNAGVLPTDSLAIASQKVAKAGGGLEARREARLLQEAGVSADNISNLERQRIQDEFGIDLPLSITEAEAKQYVKEQSFRNFLEAGTGVKSLEKALDNIEEDRAFIVKRIGEDGLVILIQSLEDHFGKTISEKNTLGSRVKKFFTRGDQSTVKASPFLNREETIFGEDSAFNIGAFETLFKK